MYQVLTVMIIALVKCLVTDMSNCHLRGQTREKNSITNSETSSVHCVSGTIASHAEVCPEAPPIGNGSLATCTGRFEGAIAVYTCKREFSVCNRSKISTCMVNGKWSPHVFCTEAKKHFKAKNKIKIYRPCDSTYGSSLTIITTVKSLFSGFYVDIQDKELNVLMRSEFKGFKKALVLSSVINNRKEVSKTLRMISELLARKKLNYTLLLTDIGYHVIVDGKRRYIFQHRIQGLPLFFNIYGDWKIHSASFHV